MKTTERKAKWARERAAALWQQASEVEGKAADSWRARARGRAGAARLRREAARFESMAARWEGGAA
jgi:hypothetical protein